MWLTRTFRRHPRATATRSGKAFSKARLQPVEQLEHRELLSDFTLDPFPAQCPGQPPLGQLVFERTIDFSRELPARGQTGTIDVIRAGDFNNPIADVDGNGAPLEGLAIFGESQSTPGRTYRWVFWPGTAGTLHVCDDPANRQSLSATPFSTDELIDTIDASGQAHIRVAIGGSVDDAGLLSVTFNVELETGPAVQSIP